MGVNWRSSWQGSTSGPIPRAWGVKGYPTIYVLDAEGRIRYENVRGKRLGKVVEGLLAEMREDAGESGGEASESGAVGEASGTR